MAFHCYAQDVALKNLDNTTEAIAAFQQAIALNDKCASPWIMLIALYRKRERWQEAVEQVRTLIDYSDLYNAACFESVAGNVEKALDLLAQAAAQGGFDPAWAQEDPDLEGIRHDPRFAQIVEGA